MDECLAIPNITQEEKKILNTPPGSATMQEEHDSQEWIQNTCRIGLQSNAEELMYTIPFLKEYTF